MTPTTIARALKILRTSHGMTYRRLAKATGYNREHISKVVESGGLVRQSIPIRLLNAYATAFEVSPIAILEFAEKLPGCKADSPIKTRRAELECMLECLK